MKKFTAKLTIVFCLIFNSDKLYIGTDKGLYIMDMSEEKKEYLRLGLGRYLYNLAVFSMNGDLLGTDHGLFRIDLKKKD